MVKGEEGSKGAREQGTGKRVGGEKENRAHATHRRFPWDGSETNKRHTSLKCVWVFLLFFFLRAPIPLIPLILFILFILFIPLPPLHRSAFLQPTHHHLLIWNLGCPFSPSSLFSNNQPPSHSNAETRRHAMTTRTLPTVKERFQNASTSSKIALVIASLVVLVFVIVFFTFERQIFECTVLYPTSTLS